jgi:hypothetical protein
MGCCVVCVIVVMELLDIEGVSSWVSNWRVKQVGR